MTRPTFRGLAILAAILGASLVSPTPAIAGFATGPHVYDTVDEVQTGITDRQITITGIIAGQSTASTLTYFLRVTDSNNPAEDLTARCDRFALLAMAKPGKYQFATVSSNQANRFDCKLAVRAP